MNYRIFNMCTDVNACDCTQGCADTVKKSALKVDWQKTRFTAPILYQLNDIPTPDIDTT